MELLNESPPTAVLSGMSQATSGSARLDSSSGSSQQSAAVFASNSGALSLQKSAGVEQLNLRCSTNNLSSAFPSSSLCLALGSSKFPPNSSSSNSLKSDAYCSPTIPDSPRNSNNFLNSCENSSAKFDKFEPNKFENNKFDGNKFDKFDANKFDSITSLVGLHASSSLSSPVSTSTSTNSTKSSSSSFSSTSNCFGQSVNNLANNNLANNLANSNLANNLANNNLANNLANSNLASLSSLSNNLHQPPQPSNQSLFCAQQLFNSASQQQKVKRTRQRVDAGEPRNSYASIANYATSRLGKAPRNFPNPGAKGLFDQLGYLGLNALLTGNSFSPDDFLLPNSFANPPPSANLVNNNLVGGNNQVGNNLVSNNLVNSNLVNSNLVNNNLVNNNLVNSSNSSNPISSLLASLAGSEKTSSPFSGQPLDNPEQANGKLTSQQQQMLLSQSFHWNTNSNPTHGDSPLNAPTNQPPFGQTSDQPARQPTDLSATATTASANLIEPLIDTMAKSRFSEDAVTLEYAKVSKHSEFTDSAEPLANSSPPMTPNDLVLPVKPTAMETSSEENKLANHDQQPEATNEPSRPNLKEENDENNKNRENNQKAPSASNSRSNSATSSRCSSPQPNHNNAGEPDSESNQNDTPTSEPAKESRVDNLVNSLNKLVAERLNSNSSSSCTTGSSDAKGENGKMNGNCKSSRRRKTDQPQQCKVEDEEELKEFNEMNQIDELNDKDDLYKEELDDEMDDEMDYSTGHQQQIEDLRKFKALEAILQQFSLQQQLNNTLNPALGNQLNQQLSHQLNQQLTNQINNLRSTRVSDRGRMNGQANSSNNSANSTPVNLSINSPRPDDDEYLTNSRNQEFYEPPSKFELDQFSSLASNLCKEFSVLLEDLQTEIASRKANFQSKLRARFDQFLNGGDQDLEQFFASTKEHLTSTVGQLIDVNFQRYKTKVVLQNFHGSFGNNGNNLNNSLTVNQLNQITNQTNQSSKNLQSAMLLNNSANRPRKNELRSNNLPVGQNLNNGGGNNNSTANDLRSSNLVDQLNRLQRSSPNLLAGLDAANNLATSKLFQNINSNLNPNFNNFKAPFGGFLADGNLPGQNLTLMQHLLHAQEEQLQKQLQKENQQDCAFAPKRKRIKASDEPRRTRTSNRITPNSLGSLGQSISSLNQTVLPPKSTSEMLANLVSREFNNATPLAHNLNHSTNASLSNSLNNAQDAESAVNHQSTNNSMNSSVFPFNNSFMNSFGQGDLELQQLMMAVNNGLNNGKDSSNRASPLSSFGGNLSAGQAPFLLDQNSDNSMSNDLDGAVESTSTLSPVHLRKAKLMFFYVRYPNSAILKTYFRDIRFNKNNTAQLVKWFSNFREFYYQQIDKYARQELSNGRQNAEEIHIPADSELIKVLNVHYNRQNHINVPNDFVDCVQATVREFFRAIQANRDDNEPSWRKPIYKVISRYDKPVPECFRQPNFLEALESNYTEI